MWHMYMYVPTVISMTIKLLCIYTASPPLEFNGSRIGSTLRKVLPYYGSCDITKTEVFTWEASQHCIDCIPFP